jgi:hypothetical protein
MSEETEKMYQKDKILSCRDVRCTIFMGNPRGKGAETVEIINQHCWNAAMLERTTRRMLTNLVWNKKNLLGENDKVDPRLLDFKCHSASRPSGAPLSACVPPTRVKIAEKWYTTFASETFRPSMKCLKIENTILSKIDNTVLFLYDYPLFSSSFLFNGAWKTTSLYQPITTGVDLIADLLALKKEVRAYRDVLRQEWDYQKPSPGVFAGYVICVVYCLVITISWYFLVTKKDGAQSTNAAPIPLTSNLVYDTDVIILAPAPPPAPPIHQEPAVQLTMQQDNAPNEEVSCEKSEKSAKATILWNIVTVIVGVTMYWVIFQRGSIERLRDDTLENFGIFVAVSTLNLWRDSLDILITTCRPNQGDPPFKQVSVVKDINGINLFRPLELFVVLLFLACDWVFLLMIVLSGLLVEPHTAIEREVCPSVERWLDVAYAVIPAIILFLGIQVLISRNTATRLMMTRHLPFYEIAMAVSMTSVLTFWGPLRADDLRILADVDLDSKVTTTDFKKEIFEIENCEIVWYSSIPVVVMLWTELLKSVLQYFYLAGTSVGYADKSKVNILVTFFKKSISQKRVDYFVLFLVFSFVSVSGNFAAPLVNSLGRHTRNCPTREEKMNAICTKRREMCPSLNFNATFPCRSDPSVVTPEIYNVDYSDLTVNIPVECYLEVHIDFQLGNFSDLEDLLMTGLQCETSRQVLQTNIIGTMWL